MSLVSLPTSKIFEALQGDKSFSVAYIVAFDIKESENRFKA